MNIQIFNKPDPSGRMSKESYLFKNHKEEYDYIIEYCGLNKIFNISFKEKVYLCINNLKKVPICKNPNCNNIVKFKNSKIGYFDYCSNKCISSDPDVIKMKEKNSIKKYGTKSPQQSKEVKEKIIKTNQQRYGGNSSMCSKETQEKSKKTLLKNYGVDNPSKSKKLLDKRIESFKKSNYKETYKKTSQEKYAVNHPWMNAEIHNKSAIATFLSKNIKLKDSIIKKLEKYTEYNLVSIDYDKYKRGITIGCKTCNNNFTINREDFHIRCKNKTTICTNCNPIGSSQSEMELYKFIKENYQDEIVINSKKIIYPMELYIFLPKLDLAFEYNGLYWHSEHQKWKYYHYNKTKKCKEKQIELIHIWEDDWIYKQEIIKSIILNKIGKTNNRIYARKCIIKKIYDNKISKEFLDSNHILGNCSSSIKIGLFYENKLISLMCFNKSKDTYELSRFCNLINTLVIGGSSKLFKYFLNNYNPYSIISYSDESMFSGNLYKNLGFFLEKQSPINYKWVIGKKREHKSKYRKNRLVKSGFNCSKSEDEIMIEDVGSYKIWDCGLKKWIINIY